MIHCSWDFLRNGGGHITDPGGIRGSVRLRLSQTMATSPWGWDYEINEVLQGNEYPCFRAYDKGMNMRVFRLEEI